MRRLRLYVLALAVVVGAAAWAGLGRSEADRVHRTVFGLALADRYPLVTRTVGTTDVEYLFWSPDDVDVTCATVASDPESWARVDDCAFRSVPGDRVEVLATAVPDRTRGGSLVRVTARVLP